MPLKWLDRFKRGSGTREPETADGDVVANKEVILNRDKEKWGERPTITWLASESSPWNAAVLDLRPFALTMMFVSADREVVNDSMALWRSTGSQYRGAEPASQRVTPASLRYRIDGILAEGVLFLPATMEDRWAIYYYNETIICVSSWYHDVRLTAAVEIRDGYAEIRSLRGAIVDDAEEPDFTVRAFDFLLRSHTLNLPYPAPISPAISHNPYAAAYWCFTVFGNHAHYATVQHLPLVPPEQPLRTDSLLHIAIATSDRAAIESLLDQGVPCDLIARDGLTTLHWALAPEGFEMIELLLARGVAVDVRSVEGATALMNATQAENIEMMHLLLNHGADPNATDNRGFTSLHRAAEAGKPQAARVLLDHGARPDPVADGHTPLSLAKHRGHGEIVALLEQREGA